MKIAHLCLSSFYIDGYSYQENELVAQHVADGHEVTVIASTESFAGHHRTAFVEPGDYLGKDGARVIRLPYRRWLPHAVMRKIRMHPGLYRILDELAPDVILFHGSGGWELLTVARYKKANPHLRLYVDSHTDAFNSAQNAISMHVLHRGIYRRILKHALPQVEKILCVNIDAMDFARTVYEIPGELLEFFPLGGTVLEDAQYGPRRRSARDALGISEGDVLFVQSGKMDGRKMILESLRSFSAVANAKSRMVLAGEFGDDVAKEAASLIAADPRIAFLGWKSTEQLRDILCAADVYVKPWGQTATTQMSLCCRCAVILHDAPGHRPYVDGNGWLVEGEGRLRDAIAACVNVSQDEVKEMSERSTRIANRLLDYRNLAARLYR